MRIFFFLSVFGKLLWQSPSARATVLESNVVLRPTENSFLQGAGKIDARAFIVSVAVQSELIDKRGFHSRGTVHCNESNYAASQAMWQSCYI